MIKLSDYLNYLNNEIIQARKKADEHAVQVAKEYAKHEYLRYFKVPRYSMPSVKMDIPLKITDIDSDEKYDFKYDQSQFLVEVNERVALVNRTKQLNIPAVTENQLQSADMKALVKTLEARDQKFGKTPAKELKKLDLKDTISRLDLGMFRLQDDSTDEEAEELRTIFSDVLHSKYKLVSSRLNELYIDPDTSANDDKDKLMINLHVEMEEEGIRIVVFRDEDGNEIEEITFE